MRPGLLKHLRCPHCGHTLTATDAGSLQCTGSAHVFPVHDGVPRFSDDRTPTARAFGYMWGEQTPHAAPLQVSIPYHLHAMQQALDGPRFDGLVLDAGCGEGIDLAMVALDPACEAIGVELSAGGVDTSVARTIGLERAHVVQADLLRLPIASNTFDAAYSYGVVHHTDDPGRAIEEIARTLKPGAPLLFYVLRRLLRPLVVLAAGPRPGEQRARDHDALAPEVADAHLPDAVAGGLRAVHAAVAPLPMGATISLSPRCQSVEHERRLVRPAVGADRETLFARRSGRACHRRRTGRRTRGAATGVDGLRAKAVSIVITRRPVTGPVEGGQQR